MNNYFIGDRAISTDYVKLENRDQFLTKVPVLHPLSPEYTQFWSLQFKRCIEGLWGKMFDKWRYCPGFLYFYGNFFVLEITDKKSKVTNYQVPRIDDIEWELAYYLLEAFGFSGFEQDDEYSCLSYLNNSTFSEEYIRSNYPNVVSSSGSLKKYVPVDIYLKKLHDRPLGSPLYENETKNAIVFGTRGGGKSYFTAGIIEHRLVFDGAVRYNESFINGELTTKMVLGSSVTDKSSDLANKVHKSILAKADPILGKKFGVWGTHKDDDFTPCPLFKDMTGSLEAPNKKNPYRHSYKVSSGNRWVQKGTDSTLFHVNYSLNKGDGSQAAVGGRYSLSVVEEVGLVPNVIDIHVANEATLSRDGRFGTELYLGTSGNLSRVLGAKRMFLSPQDYNIVYRDNKHGTEGTDGKIGFFLPNYMIQRDCKDHDGNTDYNMVIAKINARRTDFAKSADPNILRNEKINRPCFVDEMWMGVEEQLMPIEELQSREKQLMMFNEYRQLYTGVKLSWDSTMPNGVSYTVDHDAEPYLDWPLNLAKRKDPRGPIIIYDFPRTINNSIPNDMYRFIGHDPYVEEDFNRGGSVGATYVLMNPAYIAQGMPGNIIVASYIDKPLGGLDEYYENQEKLLAFYGNPSQGLWFEKNRGADCRAHYVRKHKAHLLSLTPQYHEGSNIRQKAISSFGYLVGNRITKARLAKMVRDWLLEETEISCEDPKYNGVKKNFERIPCLFLIRQMLAYNLDDNFDAFDGFRGAILGLREYEVKLESTTNKERKALETKVLSHYVNNERIFKNYERRYKT
jgi:hypothetical protein